MNYFKTFILFIIVFSAISCMEQKKKKGITDFPQEEATLNEPGNENGINLQEEITDASSQEAIERQNDPGSENEINPQEESIDIPVANPKAVEMLKKFYSSYLSPSSRREHIFQLHAGYMTEAMKNKILRMSANTDINAVIRAQDVPEDSCETLKIKELGNDWYMVKYTSGKGGPYEHRYNIPVKVVEENGRCLIAYITPQDEGQIYGDSLWCHTDTFPTVDRTEPLAFVKSFYELYTTKYGCLIPNLQQELASIRRENLTLKAQEQFNKAEESNRLDGYKEYDLLIRGFDFEYLWRPSLKVTPADKANTYRISYKTSQYSKMREIAVEVIEKDGKYYIDDIQNEDSKYFP
ncbi:DUF3828 domain-containing protein [Bacteroides bouchesdurhonensis]|uniref:DUF3828 domain-containing protein n=1 Tax=Bacteroides bouchesdurhonensis TaxID=1841855 RepID=UPI00097F9902|nr:DUF3828 domain-containing protein [Bacteroides bouchesdurhonensis]